MSVLPSAPTGLVQHRSLIASVLVVAVAAPLAYWGWRSLQPPPEVLLNCSVAAPRVAGTASPGVVTFRPSVRFESGFAISYLEDFSAGPEWTLAWNSTRPGLRALFLYEAGDPPPLRDPRVANANGQVEFWWNEIVTSSNEAPVSDAPWTSTVDVRQAGRFCVTILETSGSVSDWTVTVTGTP